MSDPTVDPNNQNKTKGEKMILKSFYIEPSAWKGAKRKAGMIPLAAVIRRLVALWLEGRINLEDYE